jgi:phospholipid transport system transporter-binding protein
MSDWSLDGNQLNLTGLLSVDTVNQFYDLGLLAIDQRSDLTVDLSGADIVGSAGIALMIAWQRRALEQDKPLRIVNAPEHFLAMASVSGVRDILPFHTSD